MKFNIWITSHCKSMSYCIDISDVYDAKRRISKEAILTPLLNSDNLSHMCDCKLYFKLESMQRCKAFKFRGALNKLMTLPPGSTVCAVSAGNHSQGVALASSLCRSKSVIFMPENAATAKVSATEHYGGTVIQKGATFDEAKAELYKAMEDHPEWIYVPPYDDPHIIAGTGTIGLEIIHQLDSVDTVVVPIGGGGLISGIAFTLKTIKPSIRIIGVNMASCPYTYKKFNEKKNRDAPNVTKETMTPLADGIAVKSPGERNLEIIYDFVDEVVVVTEDEVAMSVALMAERGKIISEGAGAAAFAAIFYKKFEYKPDETIVAIVSGGNIPLRMLARCIERALFLRQTRCSINVILPYGTCHLCQLMKIFYEHHVDIISCISAPHVDTVANKEHYTVIVDVSHPDSISKVKEQVESRGWMFTTNTTAALDE